MSDFTKQLAVQQQDVVTIVFGTLPLVLACFTTDTRAGPISQYEPRISGRLGHVEVSCLADRGAGRNIISHEYAKLLGRPTKHNTHSARAKVILDNGKPAKTIGLVTLPFSFSNEREVYHLEFHVMPNCVQDIILGSPFLRLTQTFERFAHRIHRRLRQCLPNRMQYMGSAERVVGTLNGSLVDALPDTGSDVMLVSEAYARRRGLSVNRDPIYHVPLQLADGSFDRTSGIVKDATWAYGVTQDEVSLCDFYVLPNLPCDVLLSYDFLDSTEAFTRQSSWFKYDDDADLNDTWTLSTITKVPEFMRRVRQRLGSKPNDAPSVKAVRTAQEILQGWEREKRRLLRAFELNEAHVKQLPLEQQDTARAAYAAILQPAYDKHMQSRPGS
ncbi:hypothetical protein LTR97_006256 [Elasticomyces elasticus]|uniref:Uncharacterized protein n=1 Tax=Elasticomyces elasticus TaxID=574655 RepID=A0AAN7W4G4_9PEZI|nr:hypothetical protein LTR97_006256 [Elasticomyces elasticus]